MAGTAVFGGSQKRQQLLALHCNALSQRQVTPEHVRKAMQQHGCTNIAAAQAMGVERQTF
jgi:hypothetical protein